MLAVTGVTVQTHYCNGAARYSTIAVDSEHSSCCGDDMPACPSCMDVVSSNVMSTPTTVAVITSGSVDLPVMGMTAEENSAAPVEPILTQPIANALGPPGVTGGSDIPILISSFLI